MQGEGNTNRFMSISDTVISSRIRLARNVLGLNFPNAYTGRSEALFSVMQRVENCVRGLFDYDFIFMSKLQNEKKLALVAQHLISPALVKNSATGAVILEKKNEISIMLNEEDHIRAQCIVQGFELDRAYRRINEIDDKICSALPIAFDKQFGFLTACPTNVGTGMRASTMLFLPALKMSGLLEGKVGEVVKRNGLTLRGVYGEGSASLGCMFQLSNTATLGQSEAEIIGFVKTATNDICLLEEAERKKLLASGYKFSDKLHRSFGILTNAILLDSKEFLELVAEVKLGIILNILPQIELKSIDKLLILSGSAVLSSLTGAVNTEQLDFARAKLARELLTK